jgi:hypothetical protein
MPLPMVHLAVAVRLMAERAFADATGFYLGSIVPDAIHARTGARRDDKLHSHYQRGHPAHLDLDALSDMLTAHWAAGEMVPFAEGYAAHVLTDELWRDTVDAAFLQHVQREGQGADYSALYYRDCDKLDFDLYDTSSWRPVVWAHLSSAAAHNFPPLLTASEIS